MKKIIALLTLLVATSAFSAQGTKFFSVKVDGASEAEIVASAEAMIPMILAGEHKPTRRDMNFENCWPIKERYIKVQSLTVSKYYKNNAGSLDEVFTGRLRVSHKRCQEDK